MPTLVDHITPHAKLLIITSHPSVEEPKHQQHFMSKGGKKLLKMLSLVGLTSDDISLVNILDYYPKGAILTKIGYAELKVATEVLRRKILKFDPILILALGDLPMRVLTVADNINKYRGSVLRCAIAPNYKVLLTYDPQKFYEFKKGFGALRKKNEYEYQYDFLRISANLATRDIIRKNVIITIEENLHVFRSIFLNSDYINNPDSLLSFDIECIGTDLVCIGFSANDVSSWVMPLHDFDKRKFAEALRLIEQILCTKVKKVAQNGNFDVFYLGYYYNIKVRNFYFDTLLAQHSLYSNTAKGLDFLASIYTNEPYWKDEGKQWKDKNINWQEFYEYNGKDSANTLEIAYAQMPLLKARGVESIFRRSMNLCYLIITMELRGVLIDKKMQKDLILENTDIYRRLELLLWTLVGFELNIKSPKQVKEYLYTTLKLPKRFKNGSLTTDNDALGSLVVMGGSVIKIILLMRDYAKRGTFYAIKTASDNRVRTTFKIGGTETGRLSSSKSISGTGSNLHNIPKRGRKIFICDPGYIMINADYSKAESWIVAHTANDQLMIEALNRPDFHSENAANLLEIPLEEVGYTERQLGKKISHAANYGITPFTFQKVMTKDGHDFSKAKCQELLDSYFITYPKVKAFQASVRDQLKQNMTLINIFGRKMTYFEHWGDTLFRSAYSYIPQGSVGDMTNQGMKNIYDTIPELEILLQIHDAVLMQAKIEHVSQSLINKIITMMSFDIKVRQYTIKIPVDIELGYNWLDMAGWNNYDLLALSQRRLQI